MTENEAIQFLDNIKHAEVGRAIGKDGFYAELMGYHVEALNMAIKALEQKPCNTDTCKVVKAYMNEWDKPNNSDAISRQAVIDIIHRFFTEEVDKIPTKKTEDGEVLIMCKAQPLFAMNKTLCKRIKALTSASPTQNCVGNALDMRCDDAISRQKVLDVINLNWEYRRNCIRAIEKLPPVKQEPSSSENDLLQRLRKRISDLYNTDITYDNGDYNTMDTPTLDKVLEYFDSEVNT